MANFDALMGHGICVYFAQFYKKGKGNGKGNGNGKSSNTSGAIFGQDLLVHTEYVAYVFVVEQIKYTFP